MNTSEKRLIVPVFLPQAGCGHTCVFCSQSSITGYEDVPTPDEARTMLGGHLGPDTPGATIAFYGGTFTALDPGLREAYLSVASGFVDAGMASGIRISTRPDTVDSRMAAWLADRHVTEAEIGVQSMDDRVLKACGRGHTGTDVERSVVALRDAGIRAGVQMMAGLPGDTREGFLGSIRRVIELRPDFARVFPTVVVDGAPLAKLWRRGDYTPPGLDEAVSLCADAGELFGSAGIPVIRFGLQATKWLDGNFLAGAYHPAFGHMVESEAALRRMKLMLETEDISGVAGFRVNPRELSVYKGISKHNIMKLKELSGGMDISVDGDGGVPYGSLRLVRGHTLLT